MKENINLSPIKEMELRTSRILAIPEVLQKWMPGGQKIVKPKK
ncbi:MAG: hypothetical protein WC831_02205 [Parcubacteria group bacterium]